MHLTRITVTLGIDGGGTKTRCVAIDGEGLVLADAETGSTNLHAVGPDATRQHLADVIRETLRRAGVALAQVSAAGLCLSGVSRPTERATVTQWTHELLPYSACYVDVDAAAALASGTGGDLYGVVVISGTGMIVFGVAADGSRQRAGGWGPILGDPGGGYSIGEAILRAVTAAVDGSGAPTLLVDAVLGHLRLPEPEALIDWAYGQSGWAHIASLAPLATLCAEAGDEIAGSIVDEAAENLATGVAAVVQRLRLSQEAFPLVLAGGNLRPGLLFERLTLRLEHAAPLAEITLPAVEPAVGAALLATRHHRQADLPGSPAASRKV